MLLVFIGQCAKLVPVRLHPTPCLRFPSASGHFRIMSIVNSSSRWCSYNSTIPVAGRQYSFDRLPLCVLLLISPPKCGLPIYPPNLGFAVVCFICRCRRHFRRRRPRTTAVCVAVTESASAPANGNDVVVVLVVIGDGGVFRLCPYRWNW